MAWTSSPPIPRLFSVMNCSACKRPIQKSDFLCKCGQVILDLSGLYPKQLDILNMIRATGPTVPTKIGGGGSRGSTKSRMGRDIALITAFEMPGIVINIMRRNWSDVEENFIEKFKLERPQLTKFYSAQRQAFEFPQEMGGSRIAFSYGDTLDDIVRVSRGPEYYLLIVDQAEQLSERELNELNTPNRWPNAPTGGPKTLHLFNPGGVGSDYLRRVYFLKQYKDNERPGDFAFVQMFGWDAYVWFSNENIEVNGEPLTREKFYSLPGETPPCSDGVYDQRWMEALPDDHRFKIFVTRTSEGRKMWSKPDSIRMGDLFGRFDSFAGQYFAGVWDERLCVLPTRTVDAMCQPWWSTWMSMDWGFGHFCAVYWLCTGKLSPSQAWDYLEILTEWPLDVVVIYRELVTQRMAESDLGRKIVEMTPAPERREIRKFVAGSDTKTTDRWAPHTVRELIDAVTTPKDLPAIRSAQDGPGSRVINARLLYEGFRRASSMRSENPPTERPDEKVAPLLLISAECSQLISAIPMLITDDKKPDDFMKLETLADDCADGAKYGFAEYLAVRDLAPRDVRQAEVYNAAGSKATDDAERNTARYLAVLKFKADEDMAERRGRKR